MRAPGRVVFFLALAVILSGLLAGTDGAPSLEKPPCPNTQPFDPLKDYFPDKAAPLLALRWNISYSLSFKVLTNLLSNDIYVLYMCNTPRPPAANFPATAHFFEVPLFSIATASRTAVRYLERLGLREQIRYVPSTSLITSPCVLALAQTDFTKSSTPVALSTADVVFGRGPAIPGETFDAGQAQAVLLSSYYEYGPLEKLGWIKFISAFFNLERTASSIFFSTSMTYQCTLSAVAEVARGNEVTAVWIGAMDATGAGGFVTDESQVKSRFLSDAGASALVSPTATTLAAVQSAILTADVLIDDTPGIETMADVMRVYGFGTSDVTKYNFLRNKLVFKTDGRRSAGAGAADDFIQSYWAMPEYVQQDLASVFHPTLFPTWKRIWLRNVATGESFTFVNASQCPGGDTASAFERSYQTVTCPGATSIPPTPAPAPVPAPAPAPALAPSTAPAPSSAPSPAPTLAPVSSGSTSPSSSASSSDKSTAPSSSVPFAPILGAIIATLALLAVGFFIYRRRRTSASYLNARALSALTFSAGPRKTAQVPAVPSERAVAETAASAREWIRMEEAEPGQGGTDGTDGRDRDRRVVKASGGGVVSLSLAGPRDRDLEYEGR